MTVMVTGKVIVREAVGAVSDLYDHLTGAP